MCRNLQLETGISQAHAPQLPRLQPLRFRLALAAGRAGGSQELLEFKGSDLGRRL